MVDMVAAAGLKHPKDLEPHYLMHRAGPESALPFDRIHAFLPAGILLDAPEDTLYSEWWEAAQIDSFRPAIDLVATRASARQAAGAH
jgi:hypothetical protein